MKKLFKKGVTKKSFAENLGYKSASAITYWQQIGRIPHYKRSEVSQLIIDTKERHQWD